ncbi:MAG TPA: hypothetical protein VII35_00205, partial [Steroidobacteraceae bacterium]
MCGAGAPLTPAAQSVIWQDIKAQERGAAARGRADGSPSSHLDGVPQALPALLRAFKLSKRAARVGFDFEHASQTADKVAEELAEVREAAAYARMEAAASHAPADAAGAGVDQRAIFEEIGDL